MTQREKWLSMLDNVKAQGMSGEESMNSEGAHEAYQKYKGWYWVEVGHNASHWFCVGRNADYTSFAVSSNEYDSLHNIDNCKIYRESSDLSATLAGAYLGHL